MLPMVQSSANDEHRSDAKPSDAARHKKRLTSVVPNDRPLSRKAEAYLKKLVSDESIKVQIAAIYTENGENRQW